MRWEIFGLSVVTAGVLASSPSVDEFQSLRLVTLHVWNFTQGGPPCLGC
jgi:hypothetical protein